MQTHSKQLVTNFLAFSPVFGSNQRTKVTLTNHLLPKISHILFRLAKGVGTASKEQLLTLFGCLKRMKVNMPKDLRIKIARLMNSPKVVSIGLSRDMDVSKCSEMMPWQKESLFDVLENLQAPERADPNAPPRAILSCWYKIKGVGYVAYGKVLSGTFRPGQAIPYYKESLIRSTPDIIHGKLFTIER